MAKRKRLGECLVEASIITFEQLEEALRIQQEKSGFLGQILLDRGWITDKQLCQAISEALQVNCVSIDNVLVSEDVVKLIPSSLAVSCSILPLFVHHNTIYLAMEDPRDIGVIQLIEYETGMHVRPLMAPPCQLKEMIQKYYKDVGGENENVLGKSREAATEKDESVDVKILQEKVEQKFEEEQRKRLGDFLLETGLLNEKQLETALDLQKGKKGFLGQLLVDMGWITEDELCQALSEMLNVESVSLDEVQIDPTVMKFVPDSLAASCNVFPLFVDHEILYLAMENPLDIGVIQLLQYETGMKVEPLVAPLSQIRQLVNNYSQTERPSDKQRRPFKEKKSFQNKRPLSSVAVSLPSGSE